MIIQFDSDYQLREYSFEYIARIILRRAKKNNFIFQVSSYSNIHEIIKKYILNIPLKKKDEIEFIDKNWNKFDLIEFGLNNKDERKIEDITIYDVKTKYYKVARKYYEMCKSDYLFLKGLEQKFTKEPKIISIILFENWRFSFNIYDMKDVDIRVYSNYKVKHSEQDSKATKSLT